MTERAMTLAVIVILQRVLPLINFGFAKEVSVLIADTTSSSSTVPSCSSDKTIEAMSSSALTLTDVLVVGCI